MSKRAQRVKSEGYCNTPPSEIQPCTKPKDDLNITKIDWLRLTVTDLESFGHTMSDLEGNGGILRAGRRVRHGGTGRRHPARGA